VYRKLAIALAINAVIMFAITYVNLDSLNHFHANINRAYMALLMVALMAVVMLLVMRSMFESTRLNVLLHGVSLGVAVLVFLLIRFQAPVGDEQFIRSMVPHHSSAVLMCEESAITDPELSALCDEIVETQLEEIAQMEDILERLSRQ
jgi:amino acid transporter